MDRREAEFVPSYLHEADYLNSKLGPETSNRLAILRGLADLPLAYNTPSPIDEVPVLPDNPIGEGVYRVGLEGFAKKGGLKWP